MSLIRLLARPLLRGPVPPWLTRTIGVVMAGLASIALLGGAPGTTCAAGIVAGAFIFTGDRRRMMGNGVQRGVGDVVVRFIPLREVDAIMLLATLATMARYFNAERHAPHPSPMVFLGGLVLPPLIVFLGYVYLDIWLRQRLRFTPATLTVRLALRRLSAFALRREQIVSITPVYLPNRFRTVLVVEIAYRPDESGDETRTVQFGRHLTVDPVALIAALQAWRNPTTGDPDELLNRIETILRDPALRSTP